ncbi:MAG: hypothetical protein ACREU6_12690 [Steroidobacteraceae bacterium]
MKPTSEQTRNGVLSAVPFPPEDLLNMESFYRYTTEPSDAVAVSHPSAVDPSSAYGCVDWFIYPDPKARKSPAA